MPDMRGRVAIVTGASSGIGRATALALAEAGAALVVNARTPERLEGLIREIAARGGRAVAGAGDVAEDATAARLVALAEDEFGGLDMAFNNVGVANEPAPIPALSLEGWKRSLDVNLTGMFLGMRLQIPAMARRGGGSIVCSSAVIGTTNGMAGLAPYAVAKAAVLGLIKVAAIECAPQNIRVNALVLGGIDTPANFANAPGAGPEVRQMVEGLHALKRIGRPEEAAAAARFLLSDEASFVTGSALFADGGASIVLQ